MSWTSTHRIQLITLSLSLLVSCLPAIATYLCPCGTIRFDSTLQELESTINEALDWLDETPDAELEDLEDKKKEVEQIANPIMKDLYQQAPQGGAEEDFDFGDDEL